MLQPKVHPYLVLRHVLTLTESTLTPIPKTAGPSSYVQTAP